MGQGRLREALALLKEAEILDPLSARIYGAQSFVFLALGDYGHARDRSRRALELAPDNAAAHSYLAIALAELGDRDGALEHMQRAIDLDPRYPFLSDLSWVHAATGDRDAALEWLEKARAAETRPTLLAQAWIRLGETEKALECLDQVDTLPFVNYSSLHVVEFDSVRADPRFRRVLERVGLSADPVS
jgi:tetratricopeptide (TPR) repeat protein